MAKWEAYSLCDSKQYHYTIYTMKSSNNALWTGLGVNGIAYRVCLNVSKTSHLVFSFASIVCTIKRLASKLAAGFQNILKKNPLPVVSLVSPRET